MTERRATYTAYQDVAEEWRWRLVSRNGKILANSGQGFRSERDAIRAIKATKKASVFAKVETEEPAGPPLP